MRKFRVKYVELDDRCQKKSLYFPHRDGKGKALGNYGRQSLDMQAQFQHLGLKVLLPTVYQTTSRSVTFSFEKYKYRF